MAKQGNVWTWPDPLHGESDYTSPSYTVWQDTYQKPEQWWDNWSQVQKYSNPETSWRNNDLGGQFDNGIYSFIKQGYDPYQSVSGYSPKSGFTYARIMGDIQTYLEREFPELSDF